VTEQINENDNAKSIFKKNNEGWSVMIMSGAVSFQSSRLKKKGANALLCFYTIYH
jgi:hypothetical protein